MDFNGLIEDRSNFLSENAIPLDIEKIASSIAVLRDGRKVYDQSMETSIKSAKEKNQKIEDAFFAFYSRDSK